MRKIVLGGVSVPIRKLPAKKMGDAIASFGHLGGHPVIFIAKELEGTRADDALYHEIGHMVWRMVLESGGEESEIEAQALGQAIRQIAKSMA